jgi:hypothetical protein
MSLIFRLRPGLDVIFWAIGFSVVVDPVLVDVEPPELDVVFDPPPLVVVDVDDFGDLPCVVVGLLVDVGLFVVLLIVGLPGALGLSCGAFESAYAGVSVRHAAAARPTK